MQADGFSLKRLPIINDFLKTTEGLSIGLPVR